MTKHTSIRTAAVLATGVLIAAAGMTSSPARGASALARGSLVLTDPVGDVVGAAGGPDISSVAVVDDGTQVIVTVTTVAPLPDYGVVVVGIDADRDPTTGQAGEDELLGVAFDPTGYGTAFVRWDGSAWQPFEPADGSGAELSSDTVMFHLAASDILGTGAFNFWVGAMMSGADGTQLSVDVAPDSAGKGNTGVAYTIGSATPTTPPTTKAASVAPQLTFGTVRVAPSPVRAGHRATVTFPIRAGEGVSVSAAGADCTVTLAGKPVAHTTRTVGGSVVVTVSVPKTARGKRLAVRVSLGGAWVRTVSYVVR